MGIKLRSKNTSHAENRRVVIYGVEGIGKSTFGAMAPNPIFLDIEDGLQSITDIDFQSTELAKTFDDVIDNLKDIHNEDHDFKTLCVDSLDWLENLIFDKVCKDNDVTSITDISWGKGYDEATVHWNKFFKALDAIRDRKKMGIILMAHAQIEKFDNPEGDNYDRYSIDLNKRSKSLVAEWCDELLFCTYQVSVQKDKNQTKGKAKGTGKRIIKTTSRPAYMAKNRLELPDEIPLNYKEFQKYVDAKFKKVSK